MLLLVMVLIRTALIGLALSAPEDAANHFVMNIAEDEVDGVRELVRERATEGEFLFPMINGRVVQVNDLSAKAWQETAGRNSDGPRLTSERSLTWSVRAPEIMTRRQMGSKTASKRKCRWSKAMRRTLT